MSNHIVSLPVGLTSIQRELFKLLVDIYQRSQLSKGDAPSSDTILSNANLADMITESLINVTNHPYLLVDHYMPKRLLLMESHERLKFASDKFKQFDKLLTLLQDTTSNIIVIGNSLKELDLIEAFILGRKLSYKRYSGSSLVDDYNNLSDQSLFSINDSTADGSNSTAAKEKDSDDYVPRTRSRGKNEQTSNDSSESGPVLHLITTSQLQLPLLTKQSFDYIISFNQFLEDHNLNEIIVRSPSVLVIRFAVLNVSSDSIVSLSKVSKATTPENPEENKPQPTRQYSIFAALSQELFKALKSRDIQKWPFTRQPESEINTIESIRALLEIPVPISLDNETRQSKRLKIEKTELPQNSTPKDYQILLTKLVIERIEELEELSEANENDLIPLRIKSNLKHQQLDQIKMKTGENFKELNKLKESVTGVEKKFERLELESEKYSASKAELKLGLKELEEYQEVRFKHKEQIDKHTALSKEITELEESLNSKVSTLETKIDNLRQEYQETTSKAVAQSTTVKSLNAQSEILTTKLNGKGKELKTLQPEVVKLNAADEKEKLLKEIEFLQSYNQKLNDIVKEKITVPVNNMTRNGRLHRSATPYS